MRISDWGSDVCSSDLPLAEQRLGDCLVARRGGLVRPDALDLGFEQRDAFVEFVHRQRIEWLADQRREHVALAAGKVVIGHGASFLAGPCFSKGRTVDPRAWPVNKAARVGHRGKWGIQRRSEEHTSELQSLMRNSYA